MGVVGMEADRWKDGACSRAGEVGVVYGVFSMLECIALEFSGVGRA